jgi:hypothetical protein
MTSPSPPRLEQPPANACSHGRTLAVHRRNEGDVRVHVPLAVGEVLQRASESTSLAVVAVRGGPLRQSGAEPLAQRRHACLAQSREHSPDQAVELAVLVRHDGGVHTLGKGRRVRPCPHGQTAEILTGGAEHITHRATAVIDAVQHWLGERHEAPHQIEREVRTRLADPVGDHRPCQGEVVDEVGTLLPIDKRSGGPKGGEPLADLGCDCLATALARQFEAQAPLDGRLLVSEVEEDAGQALGAEPNQVLRGDGRFRSHRRAYLH